MALASRAGEWSRPVGRHSSGGAGRGGPSTPSRRAASTMVASLRSPNWRSSLGDPSCRVVSSWNMSPSTTRSPETNARATPSSPGDQRIRRTASADRIRSTPTPSAGPTALPSQNSNRTGTSSPTTDRRNGARTAAALSPGAGSDGGTGEVSDLARGPVADRGGSGCTRPEGVLVCSVTMIDLLDRGYEPPGRVRSYGRRPGGSSPPRLIAPLLGPGRLPSAGRPRAGRAGIGVRPSGPPPRPARWRRPGALER